MNKYDKISNAALSHAISVSSCWREVHEALGFPPVRSGVSGTELKRCALLHGIDFSHFPGNAQKPISWFLTLNTTASIGSWRLKQKLIQAGLKKNACEECNISRWNGKNLSLRLHHRDGNRFNNTLLNLQILCPNCHSQTSTFMSKNWANPVRTKYKPTKRISKCPDKETLKNLIAAKSTQELAEQFAVSHKTISYWRRKYGLSAPPRTLFSTKKYVYPSDEELTIMRQTLTTPDIASQIQVPYQTLFLYLKARKIKGRSFRQVPSGN